MNDWEGKKHGGNMQWFRCGSVLTMCKSVCRHVHQNEKPVGARPKPHLNKTCAIPFLTIIAPLSN